MIYTVISTLKENKIETNKRDCRIIRQPLSLLYKEIEEYINSVNNKDAREERKLAYTTLLCALKSFYNIEKPHISFTEHGKPYFKECGVFFSISHSDSTVAVCLSDDCEVGIDLQAEIDPLIAKKLEKRFFPGLNVKNESLGVEYYYCNPLNDEVEICSISLPNFQADKTNYSAKWVSAESIMKLTGRGFADADRVSDLAKDTKTEIKALDFEGKYYLAISVSR